MRVFTAATLFAAALASAVVCIPFSPLAKEQPDVFGLEAQLASTSGGHVQAYFDTGGGFNELQSVAEPLHASAEPVSYRLPLPTGTYQRFRFDPVDSDATVTLRSLRVVAKDGQTIRDIALADLQPAYDIATVEPRGDGLHVVPTKGTNDPQLVITLTPPLRLELTWRMALPTDAWHFGVAFAISLVGLLILQLFGSQLNRILRRMAATPGRAIGVAAAVAVVVSSYPVVFLGKSIVSPNLGTTLLYENFPTLPGYSDATTGEVMGADIGAIMFQHVPLSVVEAHALAHGEIPVWNRYNSAGTPLLGQGQSMVGDPLHLLVLAANGASWAWDLKYLIAKWLFAAALGLLVWEVCKASLSAPVFAGEQRSGQAMAPGNTSPPTPRRGLAAALIVAAAAPFVGFFVYRVNHPAIFSLCYAPWALYCWIRALRSNGLRGTAAWAGGLILANLALMNSGTAKEAYILLLAMNAAGVCLWVTDAAPWRAKLWKLGLLAWAGVLFALLTAPIWGTFLHELHVAYTSYNSASAYQIQPALLLGMFDEAFYRPLMPGERTFNPSLNFLFLLGLLSFVATLRTHFRSRAAITLAAVSLVPLAFAFGLVPPSWIVRLPFLANIVHVDNTFSCVLIVLWAVLAGVGFARAGERLGTADGRGDLIVGALLLFALTFGWIAFGQVVHRPIYGTAFTVNQLGHPLPVPAFLWWYLASLLGASVLFAWMFRRGLRRGTLTPAIGLLLALAAVVLCWRAGLQAPSVGYESFVVRPTTRVPFHARSEAVAFLQQQQTLAPSRVIGIRGNFFPGWNDAYRLETVHGPDALMNPWYRELVGAMPGVDRIWDWRIYLEPKDVAAARPFLDLLNLRYYVAAPADRPAMENLLELVKSADLDVYESPTAWPRAFFTNRLLVYDTLGELIEQAQQAKGRPFAAAQRDDADHSDALHLLWGDWRTRTVNPATHYTLTENTTRFDVKADGPGVVVLTEALWPGDVRVFVNGQKQRPIRLNHAFVGIAVKAPGEYHIDVRYVPGGWYRNLALCGVGFLLLIGTGILIIRCPPRATDPRLEPAKDAIAV